VDPSIAGGQSISQGESEQQSKQERAGESERATEKQASTARNPTGEVFTRTTSELEITLKIAFAYTSSAYTPSYTSWYTAKLEDAASAASFATGPQLGRDAVEHH